MVNVFTANGHAADAYRPHGRIQADIYLFRALERHATLPTPPVRAEAWRHLTAGRLVDITVAGTHHDFMFPPHVDGLARRLAAVLTGGQVSTP